MADYGVGGKEVALAGVEPASLDGGSSEVPLLHSARPASRGRDTRRGRLEGVLRLHPDWQRYVAAPRSSEAEI